MVQPKLRRTEVPQILVIGVAQNLEVRADFEDEMAAQIARPGLETIPGNHILLRPDPKVKLDLDYLRGQVRDNHIDAVVVSRLLKVDKKVTSIPSSTYNPVPLLLLFLWPRRRCVSPALRSGIHAGRYDS